MTYIILGGRVATSLIIRSNRGGPLIRNVTRHIALFEGPLFTTHLKRPQLFNESKKQTKPKYNKHVINGTCKRSACTYAERQSSTPVEPGLSGEEMCPFSACLDRLGSEYCRVMSPSACGHCIKLPRSESTAGKPPVSLRSGS